MAILSTDPGIHGYSTRRARVWRVDCVHGFHGADIRQFMERARAELLLHGYLMDIQLTCGTHMLVTREILPTIGYPF
jgi:hypothetical protein